jgi:hypothetical protein
MGQHRREAGNKNTNRPDDSETTQHKLAIYVFKNSLNVLAYLGTL